MGGRGLDNDGVGDGDGEDGVVGKFKRVWWGGVGGNERSVMLNPRSSTTDTARKGQAKEVWEESLGEGGNCRHEGVELVYRHAERERYGQPARPKACWRCWATFTVHDRHRGRPARFGQAEWVSKCKATNEQGRAWSEWAMARTRRADKANVQPWWLFWDASMRRLPLGV